MKKTSMWVTAVAIGVSGASAFAQANQAQAQAQDQQRRERQERQEQRREGREGREGREAGQASERQDRAERRQMKREQEQLANMPRGARRALRAATEGATNIDFSREGEERERIFMARYQAANGHVKETRVDRDGKIISDRDETAEAESAAARSRGERAPAPQQPVTQAPATPATPGAPDQTITAANGPTGRLELAQLPRPVADTFTREIRDIPDVEIYRGYQGSQPVFVAYYTEKNGREIAMRVDDSGRVVDKKEIDDNRPADPSRLTVNDLPRPAQEAIRRESRDARDVRVFRGKQGAQDVYVAYFEREGREVSLRVDDQGKVVSQRNTDDDRAQTAGGTARQDPNRPLTLTDLPREAREAVERETRDGRDVKIYRGKQGQQDVFVAYYTKGGKEMALRVDEQGKVVSNREAGQN